MTRDAASALISWYSEVSGENQHQKSPHTLQKQISGSCVTTRSLPSVRCCKGSLFESVVLLPGLLEAQPAPETGAFNESLGVHQKFPGLSDSVGKPKTLKPLYSITQTLKVEKRDLI